MTATAAPMQVFMAQLAAIQSSNTRLSGENSTQEGNVAVVSVMNIVQDNARLPARLLREESSSSEKTSDRRTGSGSNRNCRWTTETPRSSWSSTNNNNNNSSTVAATDTAWNERYGHQYSSSALSPCLPNRNDETAAHKSSHSSLRAISDLHHPPQDESRLNVTIQNRDIGDHGDISPTSSLRPDCSSQGQNDKLGSADSRNNLGKNEKRSRDTVLKNYTQQRNERNEPIAVEGTSELSSSSSEAATSPVTFTNPQDKGEALVQLIQMLSVRAVMTIKSQRPPSTKLSPSSPSSSTSSGGSSRGPSSPTSE